MKGGSGEFQFGHVSGGMDLHLPLGKGLPASNGRRMGTANWTRPSPATGQSLEGGEWHGLIAVREGDESAFVDGKQGPNA